MCHLFLFYVDFSFCFCCFVHIGFTKSQNAQIVFGQMFMCMCIHYLFNYRVFPKLFNFDFVNSKLRNFKVSFCCIFWGSLCSTHVILTSGACWGGSEQRLLTPDPADPADCSGSADEFQIAHFIWFLQQKMLGPHSGAMFFLLFHTPLI